MRKSKKLRKLEQQAFKRADGCCEDCGRPAPISGGIRTRGQLVIDLAGSEDPMWLCPDCHPVKTAYQPD